jgi:streptogramin lyase
METTTMFSCFMPLALIRASHEGGAVRLTRRKRVAHRRSDRTRARFQLEGLEERWLLSVTEFSLPAPHGARAITTGPDGNLWFTDGGFFQQGWIGVVNPTTHAMSFFSTPTNGSVPMGITSGPDGNLWFTEYAASKIGMINPTTHAISEFRTPTKSAGPYAITAGPDGNLWFTESNLAYQIGEINPTTHKISEFPLSGPSVNELYGITAGPDGVLWFPWFARGVQGLSNRNSYEI